MAALKSIKVTLAFYTLVSCSQQHPLISPSSNIYQENEKQALLGVCSQAIKYTHFREPLDKSDIIHLTDSLSFVRPLQKEEINRITREHKLDSTFVNFLLDTTYWSSFKQMKVATPIREMNKELLYTLEPKHDNTVESSGQQYSLSRVVFDQNYLKGYFTVKYSNQSGGAIHYIFCEKVDNQWKLRAIDYTSSFKY